jgi:transposase-like protein
MLNRQTGRRAPRYLWRCKTQGHQFTVRVGTVMESSRIPLRYWATAFWLACASKKGVSALQIKRITGLTYKSALFLMHRIRYAMSDSPATPRKLSGVIEADETYTGGKPRFGGPKRKTGRGTTRPRVMAMLERGGEVRVLHLRRIGPAELRDAIDAHVNKLSSVLMTDEERSYIRIGKGFAGGHQTIMHRRKEYARGFVTTNSAESFFALLKRGLHGTFHSVSPKHLGKYLGEFQFRYNTRHDDDGERTCIAIRKSVGKRFTYAQQVGHS